MNTRYKIADKYRDGILRLRRSNFRKELQQLKACFLKGQKQKSP